MADKWGGYQSDLDSHEVKVNTYPKFGQIDLQPGKYYLSSAGIEEFVEGSHPWGIKGLKINVYPVIAQGDEVRPMFVSFGSEDYVRFFLKSAEDLTKKKGLQAIQAIDGQYVRIDTVPTGKARKSKKEFDMDGKPVMEPQTAPKLIVLFGDDSEACNTACEVYRNDGSEGAPVEEEPNEREPILKVVKTLHDAGQTAEQIGAVIAAYGATVEDPDIKAILES